MSKDTVTCSFKMDRETYNNFKSIVAKNGENVKGNLVRYMKAVIETEYPTLPEIFKEMIKNDQSC